MLDIRVIRDNPDLVKKGTALKRVEADVDAILALDTQRRSTLTRADELKSERNTLSAEVGKLLKARENADDLKERVRQIGEEIKGLDEKADAIDAELRQSLLCVPNLPHESVPEGAGEEDNRVVRHWGEKPTFDFTPRPHWEIGEERGFIRFDQGARVSGSGFIVYAGAGAKLQRGLINFMLDMHVDRHGYREVQTPFLVTRDAMTGTGQLPKFEDQAYRVSEDDLFLIPTAEVPVTNLNREEILNGADLPLNLVCHTPCFRREAGAAGRENRGITRIHQFDKVEMVKVVRPEESYEQLDILLQQAEDVLQALGLHYRVVEICSGDLGFSNSRQFDLEVWAPGMDRYLEVSSCSNFTDYQARRMNMRFRREAKAKPEFVHTLNGSGLALPRTMIAVLEGYQQADGSIRVPEALRGFMGSDAI
ncbi:serine--tRNA ligase [candidate division BRC1 bacterium HGW-BRC1-1]|jgi:seryl-tRNA synthetase|nr:MAG: serine--tRNA ligase [candidate division BRC1 bacterium HGW-BRC1-1]